MKKMTQWAAVVAGAVLAVAAVRTAAVAGEHGKGDHTQQRVERMKERLNLTDDQARQLQQIFQEAHQQWQADQGQADKETMRARHEKMHEQIKSILTPEQQQKFEQMRKEHRGRGRWNHDKEKSTTPSNPQS
jgi:Spy/CpxP family protein refolding chaperone